MRDGTVRLEAQALLAFPASIGDVAQYQQQLAGRWGAVQYSPAWAEASMPLAALEA